MLAPKILESLLENSIKLLARAEADHQRSGDEVARLKAAIKALEKELAAADGSNPKQNIERIQAHLWSQQGQPFKPSEIARALGMRRTTVQTILSSNTHLFQKSTLKTWTVRQSEAGANENGG